MNLIRKILKKLFYCPYKEASSKGVIVKDSFLTKSFEIITYLNPKPNLTIAKNCLLNCKIYFESMEGKVSIGEGTYIGTSSIISTSEVSIGKNVTIAWGVTIYDHDSHSLDYRERIKDQERQLKDFPSGNFVRSKDWSVVKKAPIHIKDFAWIGLNATILKGVTVGEGAVVGAQSVVTKDVPPWTVVAGNPATIVKEIPLELRRGER